MSWSGLLLVLAAAAVALLLGSRLSLLLLLLLLPPPAGSEWTDAEAATVPIAYSVAYYALAMQANASLGQKVGR